MSSLLELYMLDPNSEAVSNILENQLDPAACLINIQRRVAALNNIPLPRETSISTANFNSSTVQSSLTQTELYAARNNKNPRKCLVDKNGNPINPTSIIIQQPTIIVPPSFSFSI